MQMHGLGFDSLNMKLLAGTGRPPKGSMWVLWQALGACGRCVRACAWARGRLYTLRCNCCVSKYNRTHRAGDDCCRMSFAQGIVAERFVEQKVAPKAAQKEDQKVGPKVRQKAAQKADQKVDQNVFTKELLREMLMTKPQSRTM